MAGPPLRNALLAAALLAAAGYAIWRTSAPEPPRDRAPAARPAQSAPAPAPAPVSPPGPEREIGARFERALSEALDADDELPRAAIEALVEEALAEHVPGHDLSPEDLERLTAAVLRVRAVRRELSQRGAGAARIEQLRTEVMAAVAEFQEAARRATEALAPHTAE